MDFDTAVSAHSEWRIKLIMYINESGRMAQEFVDNDRQCSLGCWFYGEGKRFHTLPEFQILKEEHAEFHRLMSEVVKLVKEGRKQDAKDLMSPGGEFGKLLLQIEEHTIRLRHRVQDVA